MMCERSITVDISHIGHTFHCKFQLPHLESTYGEAGPNCGEAATECSFKPLATKSDTWGMSGFKPARTAQGDKSFASR